MLSKIKVKNYRLLKDIEIEIPIGKPVIFIGPNASGKSTFLEILDLLSSLANGLFWEALQKRGGYHLIKTARFGANRTPEDISITLSILLSDGSMESNDQSIVHYSFSFGADQQGRVVISSESLDVETSHSSNLDGSAINVLKRVQNEVSLLNHSTNTHDLLKIPSDTSVLLGVQQPEFYPTITNVREVLRRIRVYPGFPTIPNWAKDPREGDLNPRNPQYLTLTPQISNRGADLITALHYIETEYRDDVWVELKKHLRAEFPSVQDLILQSDAGLGRMALTYKDVRFPGVRFYAEQMSEGMLDYLCLLAALLVPAPTAGIAFDEPDARLHPSAIRRLVSLLEKRAQTTSVFVTTHSNDILDDLSDPYASVFVCEAKRDGVTLRKLSEKEFEPWREDYTLSQLRKNQFVDSTNQESIHLDDISPTE